MNDSEKTEKSMSDRLLEHIEKGDIAMKPKWHFALRSAALIVGTVLSVLAVMYIASFIIFMLHESGAWFVPGFGLRGLGAFILSLPWLLVVLSLLFIILIEILIRKFEFGYGKPLIYSAAGLIVFIFIGAVIVSQTSLHEGLMERADRNDLPFAGSMYRTFGRPKPGNIATGMVIELTEDGFKLQEPGERITKVIVVPETNVTFEDDILLEDILTVFGKRDQDTITARGIRKMDKQNMMPRQRRMQPPF